MTRQLLIAFCFFAATAFATPSAHADGKLFPPDGCSPAAPYMGFTNQANTNTFCTSATDIFKSAVPACAAGQIVAFNGSTFYCKPDINVPTCGANQVLVGSGGNLACVNNQAMNGRVIGGAWCHPDQDQGARCPDHFQPWGVAYGGGGGCAQGQYVVTGLGSGAIAGRGYNKGWVFTTGFICITN